MAAEATDTKKIVENAISAFQQSYLSPNTNKAFLYRVDDKSKLRDDEMKKFIESSNNGDEKFTRDLEYLKKIVNQLASELNELRKLNSQLENDEIEASKKEQLEKRKKDIKTKLIQYLETMKLAEPDEAKVDIIVGYISIIEEGVDSELGEDISTVLKDINTNRSGARAEAVLFKLSGSEDSNGMWYELVGGEHKWFYNLCWMFGHFMKGTNTFWIAHNPKIDSKSIFSDDSMYHRQESSSKKAGKFGSGFAREVSCCYRNGYQLKLDEDNFIFHHAQPNFSSENLPILIPDPVHTEDKEKQVFDDFCRLITDCNVTYSKRVGQILENLKSQDQFAFLQKSAASKMDAIGIIKDCLQDHPPEKIDREKLKKEQSANSAAITIKNPNPVAPAKSPKQIVWDEIVQQISKIVKDSPVKKPTK